jgi:hypothetical protein
VESAIVLPLFVFLILALLQLGLMHQAHLMTKYAAYRAVRAGALQSAKHSAMERAAMLVLQPFVIRGGGGGGGEYQLIATTPADYLTRWGGLRGMRRRGPEGTWHYHDNSRPDGAQGRESRLLDVIICNPSTLMQGQQEQFDNPVATQIGGSTALAGGGATNDGGAWGRWNKNWLNVQVSFYFRMPIPFANWLLWYLASGRDLRGPLEVLRMAGGPTPTPDPAPPTALDTPAERAPLIRSHFRHLADSSHIYVVPIRAAYSMRMHSSFLGGGAGSGLDPWGDFQLPSSSAYVAGSGPPVAANRCIAP